MNLKVMEDLVRELSSMGEKMNLESMSAVALEDRRIHTLFNSEGTRAIRNEDSVIVRIEGVTRANDGAKLRNARWWVVKEKELLPNMAGMREEVSQMLGWLENLKDAPVEEDYLGPVVFEPEAAVELFRQVLPKEISANPPETEAPDGLGEVQVVVPSSRVGRRLLPEGWRVWDDVPGNPQRFGSYTHDDEGVIPRRVELIENGVVRNLLMSRIPRKGFSLSTGHGRSRRNNRRIPVPGVVSVKAMKNKTMNQLKEKGLQLGIQTGNDYILVIRKITPLSLNEDFEVAFSGDGPLAGLTAPLEAYRLYTDGHTEPVRGLRFLGVDRRTLRDIVMAGPQSEWVEMTDDSPAESRTSIGALNGIAMSWTAPAVLISEMELRGQAGREKRILPRPGTN